MIIIDFLEKIAAIVSPPGSLHEEIITALFGWSSGAFIATGLIVKLIFQSQNSDLILEIGISLLFSAIIRDFYRIYKIHKERKRP
ncbi:hypothetical protein [Novispirillum itersonii]|uniref:Uncharacterized protein n=1 Tax=Novispirillum itersonii TaxID=189 RepID=A0A7W9ZIC4_NOVIT|nr:hypothetical protein [Novispirillum itersonii]MBB6211991.1 hypothetical protein [Novispirillum itersonii]